MRPRKIPVRSFFRNPASRNYQLSPDGRMLSFLKPWKRRLNIFVKSTPAGNAKRLTAETRRDIQDYFWKGNDYLIYLLDAETPGAFHLYRIAATKAARANSPLDLTPIANRNAYLIDPLQGISETKILVGLNERDQGVYDVCCIDIITPKRKNIDILYRNTINANWWVTDNAGSLRAALAKDGTDTILFTRPDDRSHFREVLRTDFTNVLSAESLSFAADNKTLYAISNISPDPAGQPRDKAAVVKIDAASGREIACIYANKAADITGITVSAKTKLITYASYDTVKGERKIFDAQTRSIFDAVRKRCPDCVVDIVAGDREEKKFIAMAASDRKPGSRFLYDVATKKLTKLADLAPWLDKKKLAPIQPIEFSGRDGLIIHGYLTLPLGRERKNLPTVLNVHGGPWWRDVWQWQFNIEQARAECQFLANRGYAVLQINFRGSTGYGREFWKSGFKQWGRKMQDDLTDGVKWLVSRGIADPKRVAIYGKSYGGYAALAGAAFTPKLYRAAIDYAGESNLLTYMDSFPPSTKPLMPEYYEKVGNPRTETRFLAAVSPALHAGKIKIPVLIAHGDSDDIVNRTESDQMVVALHKADRVEVEYMLKANEGHLFQNEENKIDLYSAIERFLAKHLA